MCCGPSSRCSVPADPRWLLNSHAVEHPSMGERCTAHPGGRACLKLDAVPRIIILSCFVFGIGDHTGTLYQSVFFVGATRSRDTIYEEVLPSKCLLQDIRYCWTTLVRSLNATTH